MCKMPEITRTVSSILHVSDPALWHFTQTRYTQFPDHIHIRVLHAIHADGPSTLNPRVTIAHN